jgi:RNA polymerase sigma-70 factor (ECF subfamily)
MDDEWIVQLYWDRSENAIAETDRKYGSYCNSIAYGILRDKEDAEESVSDTYMDVWNAIPPHRPSVLSTFLGKITRRISIDRWRSKHRGKRGGGEVTLALEELEQCISGGKSPEQEIEKKLLAETINCFLDELPIQERRVFLARYWYMDSIREIASHFQFSQSKVMSMLFRTRNKLRQHLEKEGYL